LSECVALIPPIACLLSPWATEGKESKTSVLSPFSAVAKAVGTPTLPAPMIMTSYSTRIIYLLS